MSRHQGEFTAAEAARIEGSELKSLLSSRAEKELPRSAAVAAFLSGEGSWQEAGKALRGAFAKATEAPPWLRNGKEG